MPYIVTKSSGQTLTIITDDTVDTTATSLALVGKNYAGYGVFLNENFVKLIENFSNSVGPTSPLTGQLWYDSANTLLKIWVGDQWKQIHTSVASATAPTAEITGDLWWDIVNLQLKIWSGSTWILIGPGTGSTGSGSSGAIVDTVIDTSYNSHIVVKLMISGTTTAIVSKDAAYQPQSAISGFTTIYPGITVIGTGQFAGTANNASYLGGLASSQFLRNDQTGSTTGALSILNNNGLTIGANLNIGMGLTATNFTNYVSGNDLNFYVNKGNTSVNGLGISGTTGNINAGKWNGTIIEPAFGGTGINNGTNRLTLNASYTLNQDLQTTASPTFAGLILTGALVPNANLSANIGNSTTWFGNIFAAKHYGDGSNLTNIGVASLTGATTTINGTTINLGSSGIVTANAATLTYDTLNSTVVKSSLTTVGTLVSLNVTGNILASSIVGTLVNASQTNITAVGTLTGLSMAGGITPTSNVTYNLGSTTAWWNNIYASKYYGDGSGLTNVGAGSITGGSITLNGVTCGLGGTYTLTADASTLTGTTLNSTVVTSSLTSVGTLGGLTVSAAIIPNANASVNLGGTTAFWNNLYAVTQNGTNANYSGTVTAGFLKGDGSLITNLPPAYSNVNATAFVTTYSGSYGGSINIGTTSVALNRASGALSLTGVSLQTLTISTGLTGTSYNGSGAVTIATAQDIASTASPTFAGISIPSITKTGTSGSGDMGAPATRFGTVWATVFDGTATNAKYADLAEKYLADAEYSPGTVVQIGGTQEITECTQDLSDDVFGVISTKPAYLMNSALEGDYVATVALQGRTPVRVVGIIKKGDRLVSAGGGLARAAAKSEITSFNVIGRSLEDKAVDGYGLVEAIVSIRS